MDKQVKYSVIIPIYNRPDEALELLESLAKQTYTNFEIIMVEDGSSLPCKEVVDQFSNTLDIVYFFKANSGPGDSRNFGMDKASGDFLMFFDSDCVIPPQYFAEVEKAMALNPLDAFGGPDAADASFSLVQKAINYAMTSVITTGGVRGKENKLDAFQPRSFNMGISREVYESVGGFGNIHPGEDPDLSYRIMEKGFKVGLIPDAFVYHKRRVDFKKFAKQVYKFGVVRPILIKWYPHRFKPTYLLPSLFLLGSLAFVAGGFWLPLLWQLMGVFAGIVFLDATFRTKNPFIACMAVFATFVQMYGYGFGFLKGFWKILILKQEEKKAFPGFFFQP